MRSASALGRGRVYARVFDDRAAPTLAPFPCATLRMECRFLAKPSPSGDPMRTARRVGCPRCGAHAWADLRYRETATRVAEVDEVDATERAEHHSRRIVRAILWTALLGGLASVPWQVPTDHFAEALVGLAFLAVMLAPIVGLPLLSSIKGRPFLDGRRRTPARWQLPAAEIPKRIGRAPQGLAHADELLRAPLTGRPCVAYELAIRADDRPSAAASTWSLVEQRNANMRVGDGRIVCDAATMLAPRQRLERHEIGFDETQLEKFLRARGCDPAHRHVLYETIIAPGRDIRAWHAPGESVRIEPVP